MAQTIVLFLSVLFGLLDQSVVADVVLEIPQGSLEGTTLQTPKGHVYYSFLGIPFAKPPSGELRFQLPVPAGPWEGTLKANRDRACPQIDEYMGGFQVESEDCLFVNIFTRSLSSGKKSNLKPVMVYIHGGGFSSGSGSPSMYGPDYFLDEDVVFVTFNYRLGIFGFLSMGDDVIPGNVGLWDQRLALMWVQKNIAHFGGDPSLVTLFGESAGSVSVMHHYLSPQSKGLFSAAIAQSGSTNGVNLLGNKHPAYYTRTLAGHLGCDPEGSSKSILDCLQKATIKDLAGSTGLFQEFLIAPNPFMPIVDNFTSNPFLPAEPEEIIESGQFNHVPLVFGSNKDEGLMFPAVFNQGQYKQMEEHWENVVSLMFLGREADEVTSSEREFAAEILRDKFGGMKPSLDHGFGALVEVFSDVMFNAASSMNGRKLALKSNQPVYEYLYTHQGSLSFTDLVGPPWKLLARGLTRKLNFDPLRKDLGVAHFDEVFLMFRVTSLPIDWVYSEEDEKARQNLVKLWTNFARHRNPTPNKDTEVTWERIDPKAPKHLNIGTTLTFESDTTEMAERISYWQKVRERFPNPYHLRKSDTWKNTKLYRKKEITPGSKQEL